MTHAPVQDRSSASETKVRRRLRILMGIPAPGATGGGPALHLPMLVEDLRQRDEVEIATMPYGRWQEGEPLAKKIWHQVVDVIRYPARVRAANPDLVHLNTCLDRRALIRDTTFAWMTHLLGRRIFLKWHGSETHLLRSASPLWRMLSRRVLTRIDGLGVLSTREAEEVRSLSGAPRCFVVKNSIDRARYAERADLRAQLGLSRSAPLVLFISRLIAGKGLEDAILAMPHVAGRYGAHLLVVGDGPRRGVAEELARARGVLGAVRFVGSVRESEAVHFYNGADILVFPSSLTEGFPMVLFQSVAAGLGVVTTKLRAALDYLHEPDHCLFVSPHAPEEIAGALDRLLGDPELLKRMRANNRELALQFDRKVVAAEFCNVYREIVDGAQVAKAAVAGPVLEG
jgi:glycosyltransferase involved in cell wall biosynthesis